MPYKYLSLIALITASLALTGCKTEYISAAVNKYCDAPEAVRLANRELIAGAITPHRVEIECAGEE